MCRQTSPQRRTFRKMRSKTFMVAINRNFQLGNRLHILIIGSTYPRHDADYAVPWLRESVRQLVERGHKVQVLAPSFEGLQDHEIDGVQVHRFRYSPKPWEHLTHEQGACNRISNPWYQILGFPYVVKGWLQAIQLAHRFSFDIVHVHWPFPHGPMGKAASRICGAPLVITSHGAEFALARRKAWIRPFLRQSLQSADLLLANSSWTAQEVKALSGRNATILPFGSTTKGTVPLTPTNNNNHAVPRILFTGRLIQRKGVEYLLRAIPLVLARRRAEFIITGDGDQRKQLEELAQSLNLQDSVKFLGFVSNQQLDDEYASCDIWVNPAIIDDRGDTEGLGIGAIEALLHRKAVISCDVGGIPDVVQNGVTGLLVPQKDAGRLADAILMLLDQPSYAARIAETGFRFVQKTFDWSHLTNQLEDLYYQSLARRKGTDGSQNEDGRAQRTRSRPHHQQL